MHCFLYSHLVPFSESQSVMRIATSRAQVVHTVTTSCSSGETIVTATAQYWFRVTVTYCHQVDHRVDDEIRR